MSKETRKDGLQTRLALLSGTSLAGMWYFLAGNLIPGPYAEYAAALPAIVLAGLLPTVLLANASKRVVERSKQPLSQRLDVLSKHVIVNVVDTRHRIVEVNEKFEEATGYSQDEVLGKPVNMLYFDEFAKKDAMAIRARLMRGETWQGETSLRRKDGKLLLTHTTVIPLFDTDGTWIGSISARTDVTTVNRLMAEQETVETLDELRDDIWIIDAESEQFTYMNHAASRRTGWDNNTYKSKTLADLGDKDAARAITQACHALEASGEDITHLETSLMGVPFDASIKFLRVANKANRFLVMLNDISIRLIEERRKSEFIAMVSHELRSPLTSIKGSMGLLLSNAAGEMPPKATGLLEIAHRNADRLVLIINDILDIEKISAGRMEFDMQTVDLADLVQETNNASAMLCNRFALDIVIEGPDVPLPVRTDPNRVIQVLTNLLSNACKFSRPDSPIIVSLSETPDQVRVSVKDEGMGIPEKDKHKIFERFSDLSNSSRTEKGGSGLGLSISKAIIEGLGGSIGFESEEGVGTTFYFALPKGDIIPAVAHEHEVMREAS